MILKWQIITSFFLKNPLSSLSLSEINKIKRDQVIIVNRGEMENTLIGRNNRDKGNRNGGCMRVITKESSLDRDESHKLGSLRSLRWFRVANTIAWSNFCGRFDGSPPSSALARPYSSKLFPFENELVPETLVRAYKSQPRAVTFRRSERWTVSTNKRNEKERR